jgi:hypothetical protein
MVAGGELLMKYVDKISVSPGAIARRVGDELVILNVRSGTYFGLDHVGARIWQLLEEQKGPEEIRDAMLNDYDVSRETFERDFEALIKDLLAQGLVSTGNS